MINHTLHAAAERHAYLRGWAGRPQSRNHLWGA
jgi:hypothetical protein